MIIYVVRGRWVARRASHGAFSDQVYILFISWWLLLKAVDNGSKEKHYSFV